MKHEATGLIYGPCQHHLDHVAPLCTLLNISLIVTDYNLYLLSKEFYPTLVIFHVDELELSMHLAKNYDVIISCMPAAMLSKLLFSVRHIFNKHILPIWCPHGNSDKVKDLSTGSTLKDEKFALVYGEKMRELFREQGVFNESVEMISVGNYRKRFYTNVKQFYMNLFQAKIASQFTKQKEIIFYAPTWSDGIETSTFFETCPALIEDLPDQYNLIIKFHPNTKIQFMPQIERLIATYEHHPSVVFLENFPSIYPILEQAAIYIGDRSSIGYDFLSFNRPMLFIGPKRPHPMQRCGPSIPLDSLSEIYAILDEHLTSDTLDYEKARNDLYAYTFDTIDDDAFLANHIHQTYEHYFANFSDPLLGND